MVFQSYALYPTMTVAGNLSFGLRVRGMQRDEIAARVRRIAELLQLDSRCWRASPRSYPAASASASRSGAHWCATPGYFCSMSRCRISTPGCASELRRELKLLHRRLGATMIHVTHDQVEAMTLATASR